VRFIWPSNLAELKIQLSDFAVVVPGVDQRLQPTRHDDAGVHIDLGVRVDKCLVTFDHHRFVKRDGRDRGGHALGEVDAVRLCPAFEDLSVARFGDALNREVTPSLVPHRVDCDPITFVEFGVVRRRVRARSGHSWPRRTTGR